MVVSWQTGLSGGFRVGQKIQITMGSNLIVQTRPA